jgi:hypothetical protein
LSDFQFVFNLAETTRSEVDDPLLEMIRVFLADIQNMGYLCRGDERVYVDGFVLNNDPKTVHRLQNAPPSQTPSH